MNIKKRWLLPCFTVVLYALFIMQNTAFASSSEEVPNATVTEEKEVVKDTTSSALTPEGNLTLVDDIGYPSTNGKQFITLVSKNGNYFYLIIDRDNKGNSTVHFLNQVDEIDLMALINDEDAEKLKIEIDQKEEVNNLKEEQPVKEEVEIVEKKEEKPMNMLAFIALVMVITSGVIFVFIKFKDKKKKEGIKPDPDANYNEDDYSEDDDEDYNIFDLEDDEEVTDDKEEQQ